MSQEVYTDFENPSNINVLNSWVFHNGPDGNWAAIPREKLIEYWNNYDCEGIIRSSQLTTVVELASKVIHNPSYLNNLV
jgi:hypothetical protein